MGLVERIKIHRNAGPAGGTYAFVNFLDTERASLFLQDTKMRPITIKGYTVTSRWAKAQPVSPETLRLVREGATRSLYLGGIPETFSEQDLRMIAELQGELETVRILPEKKCAFLNYISIGTAVNALKTLSSIPQLADVQVKFAKDRCAAGTTSSISNFSVHPYQYQNHNHPSINHGSDFSFLPVKLPYTEPSGVLSENEEISRTVYIGNLHPDTTYEDVLGPIHTGQIDSVSIVRQKCSAFVNFVEEKAAEAFIRETLDKVLLIRGSQVKVRPGHCRPLPMDIMFAVKEGATRNLYLSRISWKDTEESLYKFFHRYGEIESVRILQGNFERFAFVNFTNIAAALKAMRELPQYPEWRDTKVNFAKDMCTEKTKPAPRRHSSPSNFWEKESHSTGSIRGSHASMEYTNSCRSVWLGNLALDATYEDICDKIRVCR